MRSAQSESASYIKIQSAKEKFNVKIHAIQLCWCPRGETHPDWSLASKEAGIS